MKLAKLINCLVANLMANDFNLKRQIVNFFQMSKNKYIYATNVWNNVSKNKTE